MKLLLVDDNEQFLESLIFLLTSKGKYEKIDIANDGRQALEKFNKDTPDLVLMDIEMPELNGLEAVKQMLWNCPSVKFIAITMYHEKAYLDELISAGFNGCIFKNEVADKLDIAISNVMNGKYFFPGGMKLNKRPGSN